MFIWPKDILYEIIYWEQNFKVVAGETTLVSVRVEHVKHQMRKLSSLSNFLSQCKHWKYLKEPRIQSHISLSRIFFFWFSCNFDFGYCICYVWELQFPFFIFSWSLVSKLVLFSWILNRAQKCFWMQSQNVNLNWCRQTMTLFHLILSCNNQKIFNLLIVSE